jgi:hypothetical protein
MSSRTIWSFNDRSIAQALLWREAYSMSDDPVHRQRNSVSTLQATTNFLAQGQAPNSRPQTSVVLFCTLAQLHIRKIDRNDERFPKNAGVFLACEYAPFRRKHDPGHL